jgi:YggT family protein
MSATAVFVVATARESIANFLNALLIVYLILIFAYIVTSLIFAFGGRIPYSKWSSATLGFLRDVCEPYLSLFRRFIPPIGPVDVSPIVGILLLQIVGGLIIRAIHG